MNPSSLYILKIVSSFVQSFKLAYNEKKGGVSMIRAATVEDIAMIQQVAVKTWQHTYKGLLSTKLQQQFLAFDYNYRQLRKRITTSAFFVAEHAHNVVGFAHFTTTEHIELEALYVLPTAQHQGFGRRLVEVGTTLFPQQTLYVRVLETNTQAIRFYEQLGFRYVSEEPFSAGADTFVVHLMQKMIQ